MANKKTVKKIKAGDRATKAAMAVDNQLPCGIKVREITLGIGALLDQVGSPFMDGKKPEHISDMLPTFFVMTRPAAESQALLIQGQDVFDRAMMEWADTLPATACTELSVACAASKKRLNDIAGGGGAEPEKNVPSAATAGLPSC